MAGSTGSARQEAERLVATVLAMASESGKNEDLSRTRQQLTEGIGALGDTFANLVGQFTGGSPGKRPENEEAASDAPRAQRPPAQGAAHGFAGWSTGSAECCVCPVCRAIAAVRDPSPATAVRLATGAGDLASGAASIMRGLSTLSGARPAKRKKPAKPARPVFDPDVAWSAATRTTRDAGRHETAPADLDPETSDPWTAATRSAPAAGRYAAAAAGEPEVAERPERRQGPTSAGPTGPAVRAEQAGRAKRPASRPPAPGADPWAAATAAYPAPAEPKTTSEAATVSSPGGGTVSSPSGGTVSSPGGGTVSSPSGGAVLASGAGVADVEMQDSGLGGATCSRTKNGLDARGGEADVAGTSTVDHDIPDPAAPAGEDRAAGSGEGARTGDSG